MRSLRALNRARLANGARLASLGILARHIAVRIKRGGGTGPMKPRQPPARERCQFHQAPTTSLGDVERRFHRTSDHRPRRRFQHMPPESLRCKECETTYALEARYVCERCFGPLEVAYASRSCADPAELRRRIQAGPHSLWRYTDFLPVQAPPKGTLPAGWTPLLRADQLA